MRITILVPVYEDWESVSQLCSAIDKEFVAQEKYSIRLLMVDDGSAQPWQPFFRDFSPRALAQISVLTLRRNLGHQRAIAIGLAYSHAHLSGEALLVMDADGEDRPELIPKLIEAFENSSIPRTVFSERGRRFEGLQFQAFYQVYRILHYILTGQSIRVGNFSLLPWSHLNSLIAFPDLWNHYAATVFKSKLPYISVRGDRGKRIKGKSKMNFVSLVIHGLSALFAYQEIVGTRLLLANLAASLAITFLLAVVVVLRLFTLSAIPGWATVASGVLLILLSQTLIASVGAMFTIVSNRSELGFLPIRDYSYFVSGRVDLLC